MVRVRFAPSPTGNLHIGTLRTALFNWLYAKANGGVFVLRIEDTDRNRSDVAYEKSILAGLDWLGITIDEGPDLGEYGPYRQSERQEKGIYQLYLDRLLEQGFAYPCFCSQAELDEERGRAKRQSVPYIYSGKCSRLTESDRSEKLGSGCAHTVRFKMPRNEQLVFTDLIRGQIRFDCDLFSDFVLMKSDGSPSFNFACVVDDALMQISHVIRGEDHLSNMPNQLSLFNALGMSAPQYAHMPMILGADRSKLSKRHGATNVVQYKEDGYLPDAFLNYLSLLGWSSPDGKELMLVDEIISKFSLERLSKSGAIFDLKKLTWMTGQYIRQCSPSELYEKVRPFLSDQDLRLLEENGAERAKEMVFSVRDNLDVLKDISAYLQVYLESENEYQDRLKTCQFKLEEGAVVRYFLSLISELDSLDEVQIHQCLERVVCDKGLNKGKVFRPLRLAFSAERSGPHIDQLLSLFGKEKLMSRAAFFFSYLESNNASVLELDDSVGNPKKEGIR